MLFLANVRFYTEYITSTYNHLVLDCSRCYIENGGSLSATCFLTSLVWLLVGSHTFLYIMFVCC